MVDQKSEQYREKADALVGQKKLEKAVKYYLKAVEANPTNKEAWYTLGWAYLDLGEPVQTLRCCTTNSRKPIRRFGG
ncbi:MAG: tetratricopeptide repeat protein [Promethearchaeota archaeon]